MKRVVLLKSRSTSQGGLEKHAKRIADAFVKKGASVTLLTTGTPPVASSIPVYAAKTSLWPSFLRMEQFDTFCQSWVKEHGAEIVFGMDRNRSQTHIRAGNGVHAAFLESRLFTEGKFKSLLCKINPLHRKILELEKAAFESKELKTLFTNSHLVKHQVLQYYNVDPAKIEVIHNGVEWEEMKSSFETWEEKRALLCQTHNLNPNHFHLLFIGHGYLRKGLDRLLLGLSLLKNKEVHLSIIGKDKQLETYRAKVIHLGLENQVRFFGPVTDVHSFYQLADALLIPSFYDPFANVTVEALAMGLYVVSSKHNGGCEILNSSNGHIIQDLLDENEMVQVLEKTLQMRKTNKSALQIRESVKHLDFSKQLDRLTTRALHG